MLDRYWPAMVAKGARSWVTKIITAGQVNDLRAHLALTVPLADVHATQVRELVGSMRIDEATVHYFRPLPPATSARGLATFSDDVFSIHVERAKVGDLRLANAKVDLLGLASGAERADISLTVNGRVADQLTLLDHEPLRYMQRMHIDGGKAGGMATTRARFMFPLFNDLPIEDVAIAASSRLEDVSLPAVVMKQDLTKARLDLVLDGGGMKISGRGQVGPAEAELSWQESFVDDVRPGSEISFSGQMDEAARQAFHLSWPEVVSGNVGVKGTYSKERGQNAKLVAELDFAKAVLAMPWFAWSKPAGTAASGSVSATIGRDEVKSVDSFSVSGGGAVVKGSVSFAAGSRWEQVQLDKVSAPGTALSGRVGRLAGDQTGYKLDFSGANADIRGIYEKDEPTDGVSAAESGPEADRSLLPLDIRFNIAHVVTGEGRELNKAIGHISRTTRGWSHLELDGLLEGNEPLKIRLVPDNGGRLLAIETKNAGAMLSTLQLMDNIRGGTLSVTGRGEGAGPVEATADMRGFTYLQPETLRKLAAQASPEGAEVLQKSEGIVFSRMKARFIYDEASLRVEESRMASDVMGLTMSGKVDLLGSRLDLQGTLVPLYGINSAVGGIPVLGWLLTGGEGGGIFAATYSVKGPLAAPQTSVNPLAMLAPGFLRNILFLGSD